MNKGQRITVFTIVGLMWLLHGYQLGWLLLGYALVLEQWGSFRALFEKLKRPARPRNPSCSPPAP